jgi:dihydropteroate synthase|tara:strand:- start:673 stop:1527 length:855 start_codon:yes stop_codon:yes gene_type:complete
VILQLAGKSLDLSQPRIMGVLNCTPDSFSDGGRYQKFDSALRHAAQMIEEGADIIDVGGESTRPGAPEVSIDEELQRVVPVIEALHREFDVPVSVDTSKPDVMLAAAAAGAGMINDVAGLRNPGALDAAALVHRQSGVAVCLMHMQGTPRTMQQSPAYQNVVTEVLQFLLQRAKVAETAGIAASSLVLDPGFGFGKTVKHNLSLLHDLGVYADYTYPILVGLSRKVMIKKILASNSDERLIGSVTLALLAAQRGAHIVRVHDVKATADALTLLQALANNESDPV